MAAVLSSSGLIALAWAAMAVAGAFVVARTMIRWYKFERFASDDYWIYIAWTMLAVNSSLITLQAPSLYYIYNAIAGDGPLEDFIAKGNGYVRYEFACITIFWTILWSVKASFLALFWRLFAGLPDYKKWWWAVTTFTVLAYLGCWVASIFNCHPVSLYFDFGMLLEEQASLDSGDLTFIGKCTKPDDVRGATISVAYSTAGRLPSPQDIEWVLKKQWTSYRT